MRLRPLLLFLLATLQLVSTQRCYVPTTQTTEVQESEEEVFSNLGFYDKFVILIGEKRLQSECRFIHFYNKLKNGYAASEELCIESLQSTNMYKSKNTIFIHMPPTLVNNDETSDFNLNLLDKVLNSTTNIKSDFVFVKYDCNNLELFTDFNSPFSFETNIDGKENLLQSFSVACVQLSGTDYDYEESVVNGTFTQFDTYYIVGKATSVVCKRQSCSIFNNWESSCNKVVVNAEGRGKKTAVCTWKSQKYEFKTKRLTSQQKLSLHLIYDSHALFINLINTYNNLLNKFYLLFCLAMNITTCDDKFNFIGTPIPIVSESILSFYELEQSRNFNIESSNVCSYLHTTFFGKSSRQTGENLSNLCQRLNHITSIANKPKFSNGLINFELFKTFGSCLNLIESSTAFIPDINIENRTVVDAILKNDIQILSHEKLEHWRTQVNIDRHCVSFKNLKLLYTVYVQHQPKMTKVSTGSVCIFQGEFLSLTAVVNQAHGCKSTVLMSNNTVFIDESRVKVVNFQAQTELYIFAPRWIAITSLQNLTIIWTTIYGVGMELLDDTSSFNVKIESDGFEIQYNVLEPLKFREHYIVYLKRLGKILPETKCHINVRCLYSSDIMVAVHDHLSNWNNNSSCKQMQVNIPDYILSFENIVLNGIHSLNYSYYYLCLNIILTYRIQYSGIESKSNFIINFDEALSSFQDLLNDENVKIRGEDYENHIKKVSTIYAGVIQSRMEQSLLINKSVNKKLEVTLLENDKLLNDLLSEVIVMQENQVEYQKNLRNKREEAVARAAARPIFAIFSFILSIVSVASAPTSGSALAGTINYFDSATYSSSMFNIHRFNVPPEVKIQAFANEILTSVNIQIKSFIADINYVKKQLSESGSQRDKEVLDRLNEIYNQVRETQQNQKTNEEKLVTIVKLRTQLEKCKPPRHSRKKRDILKFQSVVSSLKSDVKITDGESWVSHNRIGRKLLKYDDNFKFGVVVVEAEEEVARLNEALNRAYLYHENIIQEIEKNAEAVIIVNTFKKNLEDKLIPNIAKFSDSFLNPVANIKNISKHFLIEMTYLLQKELSKLKSSLNTISSGFEVLATIIEAGEDLQNILFATLQLHDDVDKNKKQIEHVGFVTYMFTPPIIQDNTNNATKMMVTTLKENVSQIVLINNFKNVLENFKQWSFPFVNYFMPKSLFANNDYVLQKPALLTQTFYHIHDKYNQYRTDGIKHIDTHLLKAEFVNSNFSLPFFTWSNVKFPYEIDSILAGNTTTLRANFDDLPYNIIKFNYVKLEFTCDNASLCQDLNRDLGYFRVDLTHTGHSQYRCNNKVYTIYTESQTFVYSFATNKNGEPVHKNSVYEKMKNGDILLSPYTFWRIQIKHSHTSHGFELLKPYMGKVSISLVGAGTYVDEDICTNLNLDLDYKPDYIL